MNKKLFIYMFALVLLVNFVSAAISSEEYSLLNKSISIYHFNEQTGSVAHDYNSRINNNSGPLVGNAKYNTTEKKYGASSYFGSDATGRVDPTNMHHNNTPFTNWAFSTWIYPTNVNLGVEQNIYYQRSTEATLYALAIQGADTDVAFLIGDFTSKDTSFTLSNQVWQHFLVTCDDTNTCRFFVDNVLKYQWADTLGPQGSDINMCIGGQCGASGFRGNLDEYIIFNQNLTKDEITWLATSGEELDGIDGAGPPPLGAGEINVSIQYPSNNAVFNTTELETYGNNIWINLTFNSSNQTTCGINNSLWTAQGANLDMGFNETFVNNSVVPDDYYDIHVYCNQTGTQNGTDTLTFIVDTQGPPVIHTYLEGNNSFVLLNRGYNFTTMVSVTDQNLYSIEINTSIGGMILKNTSMSVSTFNVSLSFSTSNYTLGEHLITITAKDGHTKEEIPEWDIEKDIFTKELKFKDKDYKNQEISIVPPSIFADFTAEKKLDRYSFKYKPTFYSNTLTFEVKADDKIDIISENDGSYKAWLVVDGLNKWIDFNLVNATGNEVYSVVRKSSKKVDVTITNVDERDEYVFESIGALNVNTKDYKIYVVNATETSSNLPLLENTSTTYILNITKGSSILSTQASFRYNDVLQTTVEKASDSWSDYYSIDINNTIPPNFNSNISFNWSYNISGYNPQNGTVNGTSGVYKFIIDNCNETINETSIRYTIYDLSKGTLITNYNYVSSFTAWPLSNPTYKKQFGFNNISVAGNMSICMYPWFANLGADYDSLFTKSLYDPLDYNIRGIYMNTSRQDVSIYMSNSTETTAVVVTVVDENDNKLVGYIAEVHRYNLDTDDYTPIYSKYTDSNGKVQFLLDVSAYQYRFVIKDSSNNILLTEPKQELIDTEYTLRVQLGTTPNALMQKVSQLDITLEVDRSKKHFNVTWNDIAYAASKIELVITKDNESINSSTLARINSTLNSGKLGYLITENTANVSISYIGTVYVISSDDGKRYPITSKSIDFKKEWEIFGTESLFATFLFVGTMLFIGIAISAELALILTALAMVMLWVLGFYIISMSGLISIVISIIVIIVRLNKR